MNSATQMLRRAIAAGVRGVYPCPCRAEGTLEEVRPNVFVMNYGHEPWCPVIADPASN